MTSEDTHDHNHDPNHDVESLVKIGRIFIGGAFAIGVWVATIQLTQNNHTVAIEEQKRATRFLELKDAANTQLLENIIEKLERIERKLP
jgi:hypothetical protein